MKIIFTVTNDLTYDQRMQRICRSLCAAGYEVELVGRERDSSVPLSSEPFRQTRLKCIFNKGKLFYLEYNLRLLSYLLFSDFDAACAVDLDTIIAVYFGTKLKSSYHLDDLVVKQLPKKKKRKLIFDAHEYFTEVPEVIRRPTVKKSWEWIEKKFVPKFDLAYTVSGSLAELFAKKYKQKFYVIRNVPVLEKSETGNQKPEINTLPTLLYQGALNEGRGLEHLIEAMKDIHARLQLAGEGDLSDELRSLVKKLRIENKVEFLGFVKPDELKKITSQATIGINLAENKGLSYYYSLNNKFFDYIHAGIPQVCIDFPEFKKVNDEYSIAVLVKDCSTNEIKSCVERLIIGSSLYGQLQKNCEVCRSVLSWRRRREKANRLIS